MSQQHITDSCASGYIVAMNTQRLTQITVAIVAVAILAIIIVNRVGAGAASEFDLSNQPVLGNPDAAVKVAMFKDFLCPHCATFSETVFPPLKSEFDGNDDVAFYFLDFTVMPGSRTQRHQIGRAHV